MISLLLAWGLKISLRWVQYFLSTAKVAAFLPIRLCLGCLAWSCNWLAKGLALCGQAPASYSSSLQVEVLRLQAARQTELIANQAMEAQALQAMIVQLKDSRARAVQKCKASQERQRLLTESLQSALIQHQQHRGRVKATVSEAGTGIMETLKSPAATLPRQASHDPTSSQQLAPLPPTLDTHLSMDANSKPSSQAHLSGLNHLLHQHSGTAGVYMAPDDGLLSVQSMRSVDSSGNLNGIGVGGHSKAARQRQQQHQQLHQQQHYYQQQQQQQRQQQNHHQSAQSGSEQNKPRVAWGAHLGIMLAALAMRWLLDKEDEVAER
ncbi:hypothetical protein DUNSADRAFT_13007 [Dunaliella salina]|uniref:Encoded protein n=1 Tax=Dunaliella salina TaxID=3046 RepID=A0ABQ7GA95_DUNSA|nr:hypothetical protein DUNSADRAFT_13007 [Dunaliella salina]|eukprot:KAF5831534.1 hypothetical protein DUNSADRAFT_13007 [Dunaliella salina]